MVLLTSLALSSAFGLAVAAPATKTTSVNAAEAEQRCSALAQTNLKGVKPYMTKLYPANSTIQEPDNVAYPDAAPNLPAFCRYAANIETSVNSTVRFEVWLPVEGWNERFMMVGNGGVAGGVNIPDMWAPVSKYGFAVSSTDTGHQGRGFDGSFAIDNPETQIDFGYRAVSLTAQYSKAIIQQFYRKSAKYNYWLGCSSGGKQGLKELQINPDTFDGVIAGAAAQWWTHLNAQTYRINAIVNPVNTTGYLSASNYASIHQTVIAQCDELDGLKDGVIVNPRLCEPDLSPLRCDDANPSQNKTACLSSAQLTRMDAIWANWTTQDSPRVDLAPSGFFGFEKGAEAPGFSVTGVPYGPDFFEYQVLNRSIVGAFNADTTELVRLLRIADATDPGQTNAIDPNIAPFFKRGGKLLTYVGMADGLIPSGSTVWYHELVKKTLGLKKLEDSFRMFLVPGMGHCRGGQAAFNFGGPGQRLDGTLTSSTFDAQHDMVLALMDWVENKSPPEYIIGAKYVNDTKANGVAFERKLCPYPLEGKYDGEGDANSQSSFKLVFFLPHSNVTLTTLIANMSAPISHTGTHATQSSVASDSATPSTHSGVHDSSLASSTGAHATDANSATGAANGTAEPEPKYKSGEGPAVGIPPSVTAKAGGPGTSTTAAGSSAGGEVGADGYPEQRHGGSVGLGPNYAKHPTMGDKVGGAMEEIKGKMLKKPEVAQHGHDRKTGELYEKLAKEDDANDPFAKPEDKKQPKTGESNAKDSGTMGTSDNTKANAAVAGSSV